MEIKLPTLEKQIADVMHDISLYLRILSMSGAIRTELRTLIELYGKLNYELGVAHNRVGTSIGE